jgi:hypothetical protein
MPDILRFVLTIDPGARTSTRRGIERNDQIGIREFNRVKSRSRDNYVDAGRAILALVLLALLAGLDRLA